MQLECARLSGDRSPVVAPLAVCQQTVREAAKLGIDSPLRPLRRRRGTAPASGSPTTRWRSSSTRPDSTRWSWTRRRSSSSRTARPAPTLIRHFRDVKHRLACTATPAPNDIEELTSQAEFLGVMPRTEMLAAYFVHDDEGWRLKGHARRPMFRWMASWAVALARPSDIGGSDDGYILPGWR